MPVGVRIFYWLAAVFFLLPTGMAHGQMRVIQSRHYTIHSDLPEDFTHELARRMDAMHDEYTRRLTDFRPTGEASRLQVHLFSRRADYVALVGADGRQSAGVFIPHRNLLAAVVEGTGRSQFRQVLQHEAFHQFAHNRLSPNLPVWLNEGLAELFEDGLWTGNGFMIGEAPPWRVALLHHHMRQRRLIDFRTIMGWNLSDWNRRIAAGGDEADIQYNQAWAMVHFLVYATEGTGQPVYRDRLINLLARLNRSQDAQTAFAAAFSNNIGGFQDRFVAYARQLSPTPMTQYMDHVRILASLLKATGTQDFGTMAQFRSYVRRHWIAPQPRADGQPVLAADPMVYFSYRNGQPMADNCLYFIHRSGAPLPDIICEPLDRLRIRATFYHNPANEIDFDLVVEPSR